MLLAKRDQFTNGTIPFGRVGDHCGLGMDVQAGVRLEVAGNQVCRHPIDVVARRDHLKDAILAGHPFHQHGHARSAQRPQPFRAWRDAAEPITDQ